MRITVSLVYVGEASTPSTIFFTKPSNRSSFEEAGWPSTRPLGFTNETAGRFVPLAMSAYRLVLSWMCLFTSALSMIDWSYWNGLQIWQYSSGNWPLAGLFVTWGSVWNTFNWSP